MSGSAARGARNLEVVLAVKDELLHGADEARHGVAHLSLVVHVVDSTHVYGAQFQGALFAQHRVNYTPQHTISV